MMKKDRGRVDDCLFMMLSLLITIMICILLFSNMELLQYKLQINQLARKYILEMETTGCLQPKERQELSESLAELGVTEISLAGTTMSPVGYGMEIVLEFSGSLHYKELGLPGIFSPEAVERTMPVYEKRITTAKH